MGFEQMKKRYQIVLNEMIEQRQTEALIIANDVQAITANRIQNSGIGADGNKYKLYSRHRLKYWLFNPTVFNSPKKIREWQFDAEYGQNNASYESLRKAYGLPIDKRTLTFDGNMWKDIFSEVIKHDQDSTIVEIKARSKENQNKVDSNSAQLKTNILSLSSDEQDFVNESNQKRIQRYLKKMTT